MWIAIARAAIALVLLPFLMWVLVIVLDAILDVATSGSHADADSVVRISSYFDILTLENLVVLAGIAIGVYLIGRAASERGLLR
jgi:uncharacterized membrane protein YjgN (DUF898 family)